MKRKEAIDVVFTKESTVEQCLDFLCTCLPRIEHKATVLDTSAGDNIWIRVMRRRKSWQVQDAKAVDIRPRGADVERSDFLKLPVCGNFRLAGFNPPFGRAGSLAQKFLHRMALWKPDAIAAILPPENSQFALTPKGYRKLAELPLVGAFRTPDGEDRELSGCRFAVFVPGHEPRKKRPSRRHVSVRDIPITDERQVIVRRRGANAAKHLWIRNDEGWFFWNQQQKCTKLDDRPSVSHWSVYRFKLRNSVAQAVFPRVVADLHKIRPRSGSVTSGQIEEVLDQFPEFEFEFDAES